MDVENLHIWETAAFTPERYDELRAEFASLIAG